MINQTTKALTRKYDSIKNKRRANKLTATEYYNEINYISARMQVIMRSKELNKMTAANVRAICRINNSIRAITPMKFCTLLGRADALAEYEKKEAEENKQD